MGSRVVTGRGRTQAVRNVQQAVDDVLHPALFDTRIEVGKKHNSLWITDKNTKKETRITFSGSPRSDFQYNWVRQQLEKFLRENNDDDE